MPDGANSKVATCLVGQPCTTETDIDVRIHHRTRGHRWTDFQFAGLEERDLEGEKNKITEVDTQAPDVHTVEHNKPSVPKPPVGAVGGAPPTRR